ncbi:MAG: hypothetical protein ACJA0U_002659 [Salibacteraceae bacterium]
MGCKKDEPTPCQETGNENCEDIQNVKNFFYFKEGSYWVYEEETSGDLDTVYVTEAAENPTNYDFDVRVYSTYQDYYYHFWPEYFPGNNGCPDNGSISKRCLSVKRSKYKPGDFVSEAKCMFFIPTVGESDGNWNSQYPGNIVRIVSIDDNFALDTLNFERTIKVFEDNTVMENHQPTNHYFSENIGLVRKELIESSKIWNLVNYYIEP